MVWASGAALRALPLPASGPWLARGQEASVFDAASVLLEASSLTFERQVAPSEDEVVVVEDGFDGPFVVGG